MTRAPHQAAELRDALAAAGAEPVDFPVIEIRSRLPSPDVDDMLLRLDRYAWIGFTSANGARLAVRRWKELHDGPWPAHVMVAAVGTATADALQRLGVPVHAMPDDFEGAALPDAMGNVADKRILLLRAERATSAPADTLRDRGAAVDDVSVYRTVPVTPDHRHIAAARSQVDAVTLTSPSTVRNFLEISRLVAMPIDDMVVACIGPVTARAVRAVGLAVDVEAAPHTVAGLVDGLTTYWGETTVHPGGSPAAAR